jgi:hypothetical protein
VVGVVELVELGVAGVVAQELLVGASAGDQSVFEVEDLVGVGDGEQVVRDDDCCSAGHESAHWFEDALGGFGVQAGGGFVE